MCHTAVVFGKSLNLFVIDPDCMCEPYVFTDPINFLHISDRTMPKFFEAELFLIFRLGQMRM